jgi:predicted transcriptional regulator
MPEGPKISVDRVSRGLINQLAAIVRTSQIHDPSNIAVLNAVDKFITVINGLLESEDAVTVELVGEYFYVNESRVKFSMEHLINFDFLVKEFKKISLGSVSFTGRINAEDMQAFLKAFLSASFSEDPYMELLDGIDSLENVTVGVPRRVKDETEEYDVRKAVKHSYFSAVSFTKGVMNKPVPGGRAAPGGGTPDRHDGHQGL